MLTQSIRGRLLTSTIMLGAAALALSAGSASAQQTNETPSTTPSGSSPQQNTIDPSQPNSPAGTVGSAEAAGRPADTGAGATAVQEVTVTGSRIRQPNLTSTSPLTVVNAQELKLQGTTNVETLLNNLPQVTPDQTTAASNGASGTATVNLRNLSSFRTLVLVDGRRLQPSASGSADINNIPSALVDRVDVVTGGASAVYGADAVAGVVNFILKKDFQGLRVDAQFGFANHQNNNDQAKNFLANTPYLTGPIAVPGDIDADGYTYTATLIFGANSPDGKGNVTAYGSYRNIQPVLQATRDFSACSLGTFADAAGALTQHLCTGSSNSAYGRFDNTNRTASRPNGTAMVNNPDGTRTFVANSGAFVYNFGPQNYFQRQDDNYRAGFFAHYKLNEMADVYSNFMFMDDNTNAQIAPSGFFALTGPNLASGFTFNCNNPLISVAQAAALCPGSIITPGRAGGDTVTTSIRYRFATVPRNTNFRHTDYKFDIGLRGDLGPAWHYDAYLQYGTSVLNNNIQNYASLSRLQDALNVVTVNGVNKCVTAAPNCRPLDIFTSLGRNFTPEALNYVLVPAFTNGQAIEQIAHADIAGDLGQYGVKSPFADNGVGVAFGAEYRYEKLSNKFDAEQQAGDLSGGGGQALDVTGNFDVYELFSELRVPLVENRPFFKDLSIDAGYRFSDYSLAGTTDTYKFEANYSPTADARVRFSYNRAVRAPTVVELFTPQVAGLGSFQDPCSGTKPSFSPAQCALTGLPSALYGQITPCASAQCEILTGGNPGLTPEIADTYSLGLVFTPRFLRNFTATVDFFNIRVENVVNGGAGPAAVLNSCVAGQTAFCALIKRDAQGTINSAQGYVFQLNTNSGSLETRGLDFTANYRLNFSDVPFLGRIPGGLQFGYVGTVVDDLVNEPLPGQGKFNCAGLFGVTCGNPIPKYKHQLRATYITPWNLTVSLNWRYIGETLLDLNQTDPVLQGFDAAVAPGLDIADARIPAYNYFDLSATYRFRDRYNFRIGVNNLADKDPPLIDSNAFGISGPTNFGNGNTFPANYDQLGRTVFVGLTADF